MYIFSFFREFSPALNLAISEDLLHWSDLNDEEPILEPQVGGKYWRDPFIIQAEDGVFHLLVTDGWSSQYIVHAESKDLISWNKQELLHVMKDFPSASNAWAPEACYDHEKKEYRIFWSSTVFDAFPNHPNKPKDYHNHRIYSCTTKNFRDFSQTSLFFDPGFNIIDASISYSKGLYLMAFKDERGNDKYFPEEHARKHIHIATASTLSGPWNIDPLPISPTTVNDHQSNDLNLWAEGPCVFWNDKSTEWWIFYEYFRAGRYGVVKSKDRKTWINLDHLLKMPEGAKHGTIFEIDDQDIIEKLKKLKIPSKN